MQMFEVTAASVTPGINPTLIPGVFLFLGEADTSGVAVIAIRNYGIRGEFISVNTAVPAGGTRLNFNINLGVPPEFIYFTVKAKCITAEQGHSVGTLLDINVPGTSRNTPATFIPSGNIASINTGSAAGLQGTITTSGDSFSITADNWRLIATAKRLF